MAFTHSHSEAAGATLLTLRSTCMGRATSYKYGRRHTASKKTKYMKALRNAITVKALPSFTNGPEGNVLLFYIILDSKWLLLILAYMPLLCYYLEQGTRIPWKRRSCISVEPSELNGAL